MDTKLLFKYLKKLPGKWIVPIIALIWALGIGMRLMSVSTCLVLTFVLLGVWLVYILLRWIAAKGKGKPTAEVPELAEFEKRLTNAIKTTKGAPWYLVIGPSGCGKTSLFRNSDLDFSYMDSSQPVEQGIEKTKDCDLFYTRQGIILDTTGRYVSLGKEAQVRTEWLGLLALLKKRRRAKPIEGLIATVDITRLLKGGESAMKEEAKNIRERIMDAVSSLEITFPVYLVFTKCDAIYGFGQFFSGLSERGQAWGATLGSVQQDDPQAAFREECAGLYQALCARRMSQLGLASGSTVYAFPLEFNAACQNLAPFVDELFHIVSDEKPVFRGFYFASGAQAGEPPVDFMLKGVAESINCPPPSVAEQPPSDKAGAYFVRDLFQRIIFRDRGLDRPTTEAERRRTRMRLGYSGAAAAILVILAVIFTVSYFKSKKLMTNAKGAAISVNAINENTQPVDKLEYFEKLRVPIVKLEKKFVLFSLPWRSQRREVAYTARKLYLDRKYGSTAGVETPFGRKIEIPIKTLKSEAGKLEFIEKADIKVLVNGKEKMLRTNKEGAVVFKTKIEDGRVNVSFSTEYELTGYEVQREQTYQIQPGEYTSAKSIQFIFSKAGRVITVHCTNQSGEDLSGVPVSIIEKADESKKYGPVESNEKGIAQLNLEAPEGSVLLIYYGDSPASFQEESPDTITIQAGEARYSVEKQLRQKIEISVITIVKNAADSSQQAKPGVSVSVGERKLGLTDNSGYWIGSGDIIPTRQNVAADPRPNNLTVEATATGYSIKLEYVLRVPPKQVEPKPEPPPKPLPVIKLDGAVPADIEVWMHVEAENGLFNSASETDRMEFESNGKQIRLVRLNATVGKENSLELPREAKDHQLLLCHPNYWSQKAQYEQMAQPIKMLDIKQERSLKDIDKLYVDGAEYYYQHAQKYHSEGNHKQAIRDYQNAIRLAPRTQYYLQLAWTYYESNQADAALRQVNTGLELKLTDDPTANEQLLKQQLRELLGMLE